MKHIEPSEVNIINYITGEMTGEDLNQFKSQLEENQLLKTQVEEMSDVLKSMGIWKDQDIQIPNFNKRDAVDTDQGREVSSLLKRLHVPIWLKYVAVFLGFGLLMHLIGFKVSQSGNTLMVSLGDPTPQHLDTQTLDAVVAKAIDRYAKEQGNDLNDFKNQIDSKFSNLAVAVDNIASTHKTNLSNFENAFNRNMNGQYVKLESMIKSIEHSQRQDLEDSFTGLVEYIEDKRIKDQNKIQNAFNEIATAINNQQYQTNALLTSISEEDSGLRSY